MSSATIGWFTVKELRLRDQEDDSIILCEDNVENGGAEEDCAVRVYDLTDEAIDVLRAASTAGKPVRLVVEADDE